MRSFYSFTGANNEDVVKVSINAIVPNLSESVYNKEIENGEYPNEPGVVRSAAAPAIRAVDGSRSVMGPKVMNELAFGLMMRESRDQNQINFSESPTGIPTEFFKQNLSVLRQIRNTL